MQRPLRILLVRLSALGDAIHVLPTLAALRAHMPSAEIGWWIEDKAAALLADHPQLDHVHVLPRQALKASLKSGRVGALLGGLGRQIAEVRRVRYDVALDFQGNARSGLLTWSSGARMRIGQARRFTKEGSRLLTTHTPRALPITAPKILRNLSLLTRLGISLVEPPRPVIAEPPEAVALAERVRGGGGPLVVIQPGVSAFGALKAWPEAHFVELARGLLGDGARVGVAWGGAREQAQAERIAAAAPGTEVLPPSPDVRALAAVLRQVDLFVGVDSGPLHLAAAVGTPALGLYGPKHPRTYGPFWPSGRVVRAGYRCSPCRFRKCPQPEARFEEQGEGRLKISPCMDALAPERVLERARQILRGSP